MKQTQVHHKVPRSRGGTDHPSNLVEVSLYDHAEVHALDFISGGIEFDTRNPFWPVLQVENPELAEKVIQEKARRMGEKMRKANTGVSKSPEHREKLRQHLLDRCLNGFLGKQHSEETKRKMSHSMKTNRVRCTITGFETTPGALTRYQKAKGIDPINRIQII
jgi:hypothetical protein